jgi:antitoxin component YwqK of YwqJK toxin-antitoxin module/predicted DCC family thiol-disulfide oxidoreductase YuxK
VNSLARQLLDFYFRIDLRSLGLFRTLLASVLIWHWATRWPWIDELYSAGGVLPSSLLPHSTVIPYFPSLLVWIDHSPFWLRAFFMAALVCYGLFLVGYRTRVSGLASIVAFSSIAHRNPYALIGADFVLGTFLLWAQVLPVGERFSLDALRRGLRGRVPLRTAPAPGAASAIPAPRRSPRLVAALGAVASLGLIYLCTALWKTGETWWEQGTATYYLMHMDQYVYPLAEALRKAPLRFHQFLAWTTLALEFAALPVMLFPWGQPHLRRLLLAGLVSLHVGVALVVDAGLFSYAMLAAFALLLTERDWDLLRRMTACCSRRRTAYYDDNCGVCTKTAQLLALLDRQGNLSFIGSSDHDARRHEISEGLTDRTVVVFDDGTGRMYTKSRAMAALVAGLPCPWHLLRVVALPGLSRISDFLYDRFAKNRHRVSQWLGMAACGARPTSKNRRAGDGETQRDSKSRPWLANVAGGIVLVAVLGAIYNGNFARQGREIPLPGLDLITRMPPAYQHWVMFSPDAPNFDMWHVAAARTANGRQIDLFTGRPVDWDPPPRAEKRFPQILATYLKEATSPTVPRGEEEVTALRRAFCQNLARGYGLTSPSENKLQVVSLYRMRRGTNPPPKVATKGQKQGETPAPDEETRLVIDHLLLGTLVAADGQYIRGPGRATRTVYQMAPDGRRIIVAQGAARADDGIADGPWTEWDDGAVAKGQYHDGVRQGVWTVTYPDGSRAEGAYADDQQAGFWVVRYPGGVIQAAGQMEGGKRTGVWTHYYPDGSRLAQITLDKGSREGPTMQWHQDGAVRTRGSYRNDLREGTWTNYYPSGRIESQGAYKNDKRHGLWTIWYADGSKREEATYDLDVVKGAVSRWAPGVER